MQEKRVAFFLLNLSAGGVERVVSTLLPEFSRLNVTYIVICLNKPDPFYAIPKESQVFSLREYFDKRMSSLPSICFYFIAPFLLGNLLFKERINYVQSFLPLPNLINVVCGVWANKTRRIVISERASPRELMQCSNWYLSTGYRLLIRHVYTLADHVIAISSGIKDELIGLGVDKRKISVIYNPISIPSGYEHLTKRESKIIREKFFLCVGRHEYQKGLDVAIKAFKLLISNNENLSNFKLVIVGRGSLTKKLILLVAELKLDKDVIFIEKSNAIHTLMKHAEMFWFPSRFEGFGNVLVEAMSSRALICSTDCRHGPSEILSAYQGLLAKPDSIYDFYTNCCQLLNMPPVQRTSLIEKSHVSLKRFDLSMITRAYLDCIFSPSKSREDGIRFDDMYKLENF